MRGMTNRLTIGERVAWYRRRRGMSQEVLAGLVARTVDWLSKVENNRIELDRLSVIKSLADALDVSLGDLIAEPSLMDWTSDSGHRTIPALRAALMDYRLITPFDADHANQPAPDADQLRRDLGHLWNAYQNARFGYVTGRLPAFLDQVLTASQLLTGDDLAKLRSTLALTYQLAAVQLTKLGEAELAWISAERGLTAARETGDPVIIGSLFRSVTHALLSTGRFGEAVRLTENAASYLEPALRRPTPELLSVYGTLFLAGSMAAARNDDAVSTRQFLTTADDAAWRLGHDANHLWTAFGPTNVTIHRVATATELGDVQVAIDLGPQVDTTALPMERRVRHALEVARAYSAWNRLDDALETLLAAERMAPEQVRYHMLGRSLVLGWIRKQRGKPSTALVELARRLNVLD
ncbi:MAG: helix-turn-helix domain-containing protein [Micromonosporaceae bacterium]|nr:helix-turn-helix domain-containing protein [Micromonosporaceae bacterium]